MADFFDNLEALRRKRLVAPWMGRLKVVGLLLCSGTSLVGVRSARAADDSITTAIASRVADDYVRTKQPDGSFTVETYTFGDGGYWGGDLDDKTISGRDFMRVAKVIAVPLKMENYLPSENAKATKLLIMVYWGTTIPPGRVKDSTAFQNVASAMNALQQAKAEMSRAGGSAIQRALNTSSGPPDEENALDTALMALNAEEARRRQVDGKNSAMLGYDSLWESTLKYEDTPFVWRNDVLDELEERRYFVVLMAYDFPLMLKEKKHKLLWETRFSITERGHQFDKDLPAMALQAARFFGQDSKGLVRKPLKESVNLGELKIIGVEPDKK